jgi:3-phosphoglycerate kinase
MLPTLTAQDVKEKKVLLRLDLDVTKDFSRIERAKDTLKFLVENSAKTIIIGHKGRPKEGGEEDLSLSTLVEAVKKVAEVNVKFVHDIVGEEARVEAEKLKAGELMMLENLRFDSREEANDASFAKSLAALGDFYVNEAFAVSHRAHASIVGVPKLLSHAPGLRFKAEMERLGKVLDSAKKPVLIIISGVKEDKVEMAKALAEKFDKVLVGGALPKYFGDTNPNPEKMMIGNLTFDGFDITLNTAEKFKVEIAKAGTIVLAGVLGKYEDEGYRQGTEKVFRAVASSSAFKVAGGGDTEAAISIFGLEDKFDWISVGGGAMLEYLIKGTLPGIEALLE